MIEMLKKDDIIDQLQWLYCNANRYELIHDVNYPEIKDGFVGQISERMNAQNYTINFEQMYFDSRFSVLLADDSLIFFEYRFDDNENVIQHNLSYIPVPYEYTSETDDDSLDATRYEHLNRYLRIDFDSLGRTEFIHAYVHMHMGLFQNSTRFPVSHIISPLEFLSLIFTYYYLQPISFPEEAHLISKHVSRLSENELEHFRFIFGNVISPT